MANIDWRGIENMVPGILQVMAFRQQQNQRNQEMQMQRELLDLKKGELVRDALKAKSDERTNLITKLFDSRNKIYDNYVQASKEGVVNKELIKSGEQELDIINQFFKGIIPDMNLPTKLAERKTTNVDIPGTSANATFGLTATPGYKGTIEEIVLPPDRKQTESDIQLNREKALAKYKSGLPAEETNKPTKVTKTKMINGVEHEYDAWVWPGTDREVPIQGTQKRRFKEDTPSIIEKAYKDYVSENRGTKKKPLSFNKWLTQIYRPSSPLNMLMKQMQSNNPGDPEGIF